MLKLLVFEYKLVDYQYFMDEMQDYEIPILIENLSVSQKTNWIHTRYLMWSSLKPYLKKKSMTPSDLFPLPWDEDTSDTTTTNIKLTDANVRAIRESINKRGK